LAQKKAKSGILPPFLPKSGIAPENTSPTYGIVKEVSRGRRAERGEGWNLKQTNKFVVIKKRKEKLFLHISLLNYPLNEFPVNSIKTDYFSDWLRGFKKLIF
jgi:hypothetical protein